MLRAVLGVLGLAGLLSACASADRAVQMQYRADPQVERVPSLKSLTVFRFADVRGKEGDGDLRRVGGTYNAYGMRLARVLSPDPWPEALAQYLSAAFTRRGVQVITVPDREYGGPANTISTPLALGGDIKNFSTEVRWVSYQAHVSGTVRMYDSAGELLLEKEVAGKARGDEYGNPWFAHGQDPMANILNAALERYITAVITDKDVLALLAGS